MIWTRCLLLLLFWAILAGCSPHVSEDPFFVSEESYYVSLKTFEELNDYLAWTDDRVAMISAHRGGPEPGYPENCIATFENALQYAPCLIECDVRVSQDSVLVMMHDKTLDRTTTGIGLVSDHTLAELKELRLKDNEGETTSHVIPTLSEVLRWAKGRAIVELDVKLPVTPEAIVAIIQEHHAEMSTVVITYSTPTALRYYELDPELMISASARDMEGARRLLASGIDPTNLIAFVGVYEPPDSLYALLHAHDIRAILGTMGNLDRRAEKLGSQMYGELIRNGADILATDRVAPAAQAIGYLPR
jgi:glycerophosphoryl diester phosphodiesterase